MLFKLLSYYPVVFVNRPLLRHDKAMADWTTHLVSKLAQKQSSRDVNYECTVVTGAVQEWQHAYIQHFYLWQFVSSVDWYRTVDMCMWLTCSPTLMCEFLQIQSCS